MRRSQADLQAPKSSKAGIGANAVFFGACGISLHKQLHLKKKRYCKVGIETTTRKLQGSIHVQACRESSVCHNVIWNLLRSAGYFTGSSRPRKPQLQSSMELICKTHSNQLSECLHSIVPVYIKASIVDCLIWQLSPIQRNHGDQHLTLARL